MSATTTADTNKQINGLSHHRPDVTMQREICDKIMKIDRNIRFVGVVSNKGEVIAGGFCNGVEPLLSGQDEQQMYVQSLSSMNMLRDFRSSLGDVVYSITEYKKVALVTFPLADGILCLSASSKADINKIKERALQIINSFATTKQKIVSAKKPQNRRKDKNTAKKQAV